MKANRNILVHICCAPCAAPSCERLMLRGYTITLYFSNSNIYPKSEYNRRLQNACKLAKIWNVDIKEDLYDHSSWLKEIEGLEDEPEQGQRCIKCFNYNLKRTAILADRLNFSAFTTTLTLSPRKISKIIFEIGEKYHKFASFNFKKENGFFRSIQLCKEYDLYRQNYCGCEFSLREAKLKEKE